jgi:hypothetical protein
MENKCTLKIKLEKIVLIPIEREKKVARKKRKRKNK